MAYNTVTRYLTEMEDFMVGPVICVNPPQDYHEYVYFLQVRRVADRVREFPPDYESGKKRILFH